MGFSPVVQRIDSMVRPSIESLGYELVRVRLSSQRGKQCLQLMAEPTGGAREMTVEDCAKISRHVSALLDVEDPVSGEYNLEVSSPGIDRPLISAKDFERFAGHTAKVEMEWPVEGRKRFRGDILAVKDGEVSLKLEDGGEVSLEIEGIQNAKLVLTDALIESHLAAQNKSKEDQ